MQPGVRITRTGLALVGIIIVVLLILVYLGHRAAGEIQYNSCTQLEAAGHSNIKKGDPLYEARFDRNSNDVACEL